MVVNFSPQKNSSTWGKDLEADVLHRTSLTVLEWLQRAWVKEQLISSHPLVQNRSIQNPSTFTYTHQPNLSFLLLILQPDITETETGRFFGSTCALLLPWGQKREKKSTDGESVQSVDWCGVCFQRRDRKGKKIKSHCTEMLMLKPLWSLWKSVH